MYSRSLKHGEARKDIFTSLDILGSGKEYGMIVIEYWNTRRTLETRMVRYTNYVNRTRTAYLI